MCKCTKCSYVSAEMYKVYLEYCHGFSEHTQQTHNACLCMGMTSFGEDARAESRQSFDRATNGCNGALAERT